MTQEEKDGLLEEAKRKYPIGTRAICLTGGLEETIETTNFEWVTDYILIVRNINMPPTRVWKYNKWAKITYSPITEKKELSSPPEYVECIGEYVEFTKSKIYKLDDGRIPNNNGYLPNEKYVAGEKYYNYEFRPANKEQWDAQNKPKQEEKAGFKKDDYIVVLRDKTQDSKYIKHNYCFIHNGGLDGIGFSTSFDLEGNTTTTSSILFDEKNTWRYATAQEIAEYDRIGAPYDVSTLKTEKSLVGRWLKWTFSENGYGGVLRNHYYKIIEDDDDDINHVRVETYGHTSRELTQYWELMPEGFNPDMSYEKHSNSQLIEIAKSKYTPGTKFDSVGGYKNCIVPSDVLFLFKDQFLEIHDSKDKYIGSVYRKSYGQWAEILKQGLYVPTSIPTFNPYSEINLETKPQIDAEVFNLKIQRRKGSVILGNTEKEVTINIKTKQSIKLN